MTGSCQTGFVAINNTCAQVPASVLSDSLNGPAKLKLSAQQAIYGRMLYLAANNAQGCVEVVGTTDGACANPAAWATFPNADWTYDAPSKEWRATTAANSFPPGMYRSFLRNSITGATMTPFVFTLTTCGWTTGPVIGGTATPQNSCSPTNAGATLAASGYTWTCTCP